MHIQNDSVLTTERKTKYKPDVTKKQKSTTFSVKQIRQEIYPQVLVIRSSE